VYSVPPPPGRFQAGIPAQKDEGRLLACLCASGAVRVFELNVNSSVWLIRMSPTSRAAGHRRRSRQLARTRLRAHLLGLKSSQECKPRLGQVPRIASSAAPHLLLALPRGAGAAAMLTSRPQGQQLRRALSARPTRQRFKLRNHRHGRPLTGPPPKHCNSRAAMLVGAFLLVMRAGLPCSWALFSHAS